MANLRLHTPEGTSDSLPNEALNKRTICSRIMEVFTGYGYAEVVTPTFEYYDVFADEMGLLSQEAMLKFFDPEGRILTLRPDLTTPLARMTATKLEGDVQKLWYVGNVFRNHKKSIRPKEAVQAGIELIGVGTADADAEVIAMTIHALQACGLQDFQIEIGQVDIFKDLMKQTGLDETVTEQIRIFIDQKNILGVQELLEHHSISNELAQIIMEMPSMFGGIEVLEQAEALQLSPRSRAAIANLREVYDILCDYGLADFVSIDLAMVQSIDYYTGIIFKGFARGLGFEVCTGGRYDTLLSRFGTQRSATGAALSVDLLAAALFRQGNEKQEFRIDALVCGGFYERKAARTLAAKLRACGLVVENYLDVYDQEKALCYAKSRNIKQILVCHSGGTVTLHDLLERTSRDVNEEEATALVKGGIG